ncbi:SMP-30/gluconolactonase/LRE family protein [Sphingopyxis sp.]|uniref:SMP-30/gluconolactonase/LRE family protein n=1 Tax=Sphingopyxis sp. TaxID=1908224 RepID=UPI002D7F6637|nr:SMP-30/gluconolactonase/LRE family protein [Sphingopyxis sp.]
MTITAVSPAGAKLGEGALWDPDREILWWVDIKAPALHAHNAASGANHRQPLPFRLTALGLAHGGTLVASGDPGFVRLAVADDLSVSIGDVIAVVDEPAGNRFNDGKVDSEGRFWAGTMDDAEKAARGSLYRLDPGGTVTAVRGGIMVPNGPAFLADGTMLVTDSAAQRIAAVTLDADGNPVAERPFASFSPEQGYPDGMAVDAENHVWIAFWDGWCLRRLSPDGRIVREIPMPVQRPTCPAFGGRDLDRLYITSATVGLTPDALAQQPLAGALLCLTGEAGRSPPRFAG